MGCYLMLAPTPTVMLSSIALLTNKSMCVCMEVEVLLINASAYRPIGRYRRPKHRKLMTSLKPVADAPLRQLTLTN